MTDGYLTTFADLLAEWGHAPSCSSRTCRGCLLQTTGTLWPQSFTDWPQSATASTTGLWKRPPLEHPTADDDGGALLGTPRTSTKNGASSVAVETGDHRHRREAQIAMLKTPTANLAINGGSQHPEKRKAGGHGPTLADEIEHLLPTPMAHDAKTNASPSRQNRKSPGLGAVEMLLPTPTAQAAKHGSTRDVTANSHGYNLWDLPHVLSDHTPEQ